MLLDECVSRRLARAFGGEHVLDTVTCVWLGRVSAAMSQNKEPLLKQATGYVQSEASLLCLGTYT